MPSAIDPRHNAAASIRSTTGPCTAPLLSPSERETRVCVSCAAGWETDTNGLAMPMEVAEHGALMAGAAWERRRGMGHDPKVTRAVLGRRQGTTRETQRLAAGVC